MSKHKVIVTCAVTGSIHTPSMSPHLPVTAEEIAEAAIGAAEAGAAIVQLHARDPAHGQPDQSPERFHPFLKVIKQRANCVVNITTGGAASMTIEERLKPVALFKPEVASLNMGSMNFGLYPMLERFREFRHAWERPYLESSKERIFKNTFADIEHILTTCADNGTRFEIECYDIGHLYTLAHFVDRGLVKPPFFVQSVFGMLGGIGAHPEDVMHMWRTADRLFGDDYRWSVLGVGLTSSRSPCKRSRSAAISASVSRTVVDRARRARAIERRAGRQGSPPRRGVRPRNGDARRGASDPPAQGRRPRRVLRERQKDMMTQSADLELRPQEAKASTRAAAMCLGPEAGAASK